VGRVDWIGIRANTVPFGYVCDVLSPSPLSKNLLGGMMNPPQQVVNLCFFDSSYHMSKAFNPCIVTTALLIHLSYISSFV